MLVKSHILCKHSKEELEYRTLFSRGGYAEKILVWQSGLVKNVATLHIIKKKSAMETFQKLHI